jgi:transposase
MTSDEIRRLLWDMARVEGYTVTGAELAKRLGVNKDTVSRWIQPENSQTSHRPTGLYLRQLVLLRKKVSEELDKIGL